MDVLIPAAGESRRLRPLTEDKPKTLLTLLGDTILGHIINVCRANQLTNFHLLVGHGAQHVKTYCQQTQQAHPELRFSFIDVPDYVKKGNIWTVFQAAHLFDRDLLLVNSDTLVHPEIITNLLAHPAHNVLAVDDKKALGEEEMKVQLDDGRVVRIHKSLDPDTADGEYIGALKFSGQIKSELVQSFQATIAANPKLYYEDALQHAIDRGARFEMVSTGGLPNIEIDTPQDLEDAAPVIQSIQAAL